MYIKGEALHGTVTVGFTISGERGDWTVRVVAPGIVVKEDQTTEKTWFPLFTEMLATAVDNATRRRFPERAAVATSGSKR